MDSAFELPGVWHTVVCRLVTRAGSLREAVVELYQGVLSVEVITATLRWLDLGAEYAHELAALEYLRDPDVFFDDEELNGTVDVLLTVAYDVVRHYPEEPGQGWEVN